MALAFPLIGHWLFWKIGDGAKLRVSIDPWIGSGEEDKLSDGLINILHRDGIFFLKQAAAPETTTIWRQG
jgi:hypothetical protein